jgi:hypothetical protein
MQIMFTDKARTDEKEEHTREYVSIFRRSAEEAALRFCLQHRNWALDVFLR